MKLLLFRTGDQQFALPLESVEQVVQAVDITFLPDVPDYISGVINYHGSIIPVLNMRILFKMTRRELKAIDQFVIVKTPAVFMALWVESTRVVVDMSIDDFIDINKIRYGEKYVKSIIKSKKEIILLNDVDKFLSKKELQELEKALNKVKLPNKS